MTNQHNAVLHAHISSTNDHLTMLVNVVEQLEQARGLSEFMRAAIRTAVEGCVHGVARIEETVRAV